MGNNRKQPEGFGAFFEGGAEPTTAKNHVQVGHIPRSSTEQLWITWQPYRDKLYLQCRIFWSVDGSPPWHPSRKGIAVSKEDSPKFLELVKKAAEAITT